MFDYNGRYAGGWRLHSFHAHRSLWSQNPDGCVIVRRGHRTGRNRGFCVSGTGRLRCGRLQLCARRVAVVLHIHFGHWHAASAVRVRRRDLSAAAASHWQHVVHQYDIDVRHCAAEDVSADDGTTGAARMHGAVCHRGGAGPGIHARHDVGDEGPEFGRAAACGGKAWCGRGKQYVH